MTVIPPRGVEERIEWFLNHKPAAPGMCAQHSWHSLGGNRGNPPAWGASDANEVYSKVVRSGRYFRGTPKKGALVLWKYGQHGHAAICYNAAGTKIATTDPSTGLGKVGIEPIDYPKKWGASNMFRIWTDQYNGVRFPVGEDLPVSTWMRTSNKPENTLTVPKGVYVTVDVDVEDPPRGGTREDRMVYLNVTPKWKINDKKHPDYYKQLANLRVRWVREGTPADETAFQDFTITAIRSSFLTNNYHWEVGERGRGGKWQIQIDGPDVLSATVGTRYSKSAVE